MGVAYYSRLRALLDRHLAKRKEDQKLSDPWQDLPSSLPPLTLGEQEDPGPSATDRMALALLSIPTPGETQEDVDPGPSAVDRGSGPEFSRVVKDIDGRDMVLTDATDAPWSWDPEASPKFTVTQTPEVLAQLQRIEDMLVGLLKR